MSEEFDLLKEIPTGLLRWYPFRRSATALYVGTDSDAMAHMLRNSGLIVTVYQPEKLENISRITEKYAYIICVTYLEKIASPVKYLSLLKNLLTADGIMLLGMNNRFGMRYFCGDRDPYTLRNYDSIENYRLINDSDLSGRMYSQAELQKMLQEVGLCGKFYAVLPDLRDPNFIFAEGYRPNEDVINRLFPSYNYPGSVFLQEECLCQTLFDNNLFYPLANAYLIECINKDSASPPNFSDVRFATLTLSRGKKNAMITAVHNEDTVTKTAVWSEGNLNLEKLQQNTQILKSRGIRVIEGTLNDNIHTMPYVQAPTGQVYMQDLLHRDKNNFLTAMDRFRELIFQSSDVYLGKYNMVGREVSTLLMKNAFIDMVPLNSFFLDGDFVFYDQEFILNDYPFDAVVFRMVASFYAYHDELEKILPSTEVYARYGILEQRNLLFSMEAEFLQNLRENAPRLMQEFYNPIRRNLPQVRENRERINWTEKAYQRHFVQVFDKLDSRKVIVFGAGNYAKKFIESYGQQYPIYTVIDNRANDERRYVCGIKVQSPAILQKLLPGEYKVIVCVKNYMPITQQLDDMEVMEYGIFNPERKYTMPNNWRPKPSESIPADSERKKFHIGYVAGVFDLFHIGHLNVLRRAKEQCDYLIAGVVSDRQVCEGKKVEPFIPFTERIEIVKSCRYVDEVYEIPFEHPDTDYAWEKYHFDVQFSGSDYEHDPIWLAKKKFLEERGATMVFFPYTQSTSSTKLKELIKKRMI